MHLTTFQYTANQGLSNEWRIEKSQFSQFNLIVGKNASGKSKLTKAINSLASLFRGKYVIESQNDEWQLLFNANELNCQLEYLLKIEKGFVTKEQLFMHKNTNKCIVLERDESGVSTIWTEKPDRLFKFQARKIELAIAQRSQSIQRPFIKLFYHWANPLNFYEFGTDVDKQIIKYICDPLVDINRTVVFDDFGCKLDHESSPIVTKKLVKNSSRSPAQFILTTNNQFVVNSVPLECLSVIERSSNVIKLHNIFNSRDKFEEFEFIGLNNFDLFTSEFLL